MRELPPIFVISLAGSQRRAAIATSLARWRGSWSFFDAVDGRELSPDVLADVYDERAAMRAYGYPLTPAEIGCALSHRGVHERIVTERLRAAIVLEDDAVIDDAFFDFPFRRIAGGYDVVSFYTSFGYVRARPEQTIEGVGIHRAAGRVRNTVGYMVSDSGARKLAAAAHVVRNVADWPVHPLDLEFYVTDPALVHHAGVESHMEPLRGRVRRAWNARDGVFSRLTSGLAAQIADPLFVKFFVRRSRYDGPRDYYRREIAEPLKRLFPCAFRVLRDPPLTRPATAPRGPRDAPGRA